MNRLIPLFLFLVLPLDLCHALSQTNTEAGQRFEDVIGILEQYVCPAATKEFSENLLEVNPYLLKSFSEFFSAFLIK